MEDDLSEFDEKSITRGGEPMLDTHTKNAAKTVCRIRLQGSGTASGFLCVLLTNKHPGFMRYGLCTNNHVLKDKLLQSGKPIQCEFKKKKLQLSVTGYYWSSKELDATFVELSQEQCNDITGSGLSFLRTADRDAVVGEPIYISQHPGGGELAHANGVVHSVGTGFDLEHTASTDRGSSGSPVIDKFGNVVGIHKKQHSQKDVNIAVRMTAIVEAIWEDVDKTQRPSAQAAGKEKEAARWGGMTEEARKVSQSPNVSATPKTFVMPGWPVAGRAMDSLTSSSTPNWFSLTSRPVLSSTKPGTKMYAQTMRPAPVSTKSTTDSSNSRPVTPTSTPGSAKDSPTSGPVTRPQITRAVTSREDKEMCPTEYMNPPEKMAEIAKAGNVSGLAMLNNEIYVALSRKPDLQVYKADTGNRHRMVSVNGLRDPRGLAACQLNNCIYVCGCDDKVVYIITPTRGLVKQWATGEKPFGASVTMSGNVVVTFPYGRQVMLQEFSSQGQQQRAVLLPAMSSPWHAVQLTEDTYVVCHGFQDSLHRVCVIDMEGRILREYGGKQGAGEKQLNTPRQVAVDERGRVLVADENNHSVLLLDDRLELMTRLLTQQHGVWGPSRLWLDVATGRLVVNSSQAVCVFRVY